jgi:hypothetical protein
MIVDNIQTNVNEGKLQIKSPKGYIPRGRYSTWTILFVSSTR